MDKTALITGASAGIGAELAKRCAREGHDVVLVARRRDRLAALADELRTRHAVRTFVVDADLGDPAAPQKVYDEVARLGLAVDVLVNNAGFGSNGPFAALDLARELEQVRVNISALVHLTGLFLPGMRARGRGRVLNLGSTAGFQPGPFMATYYATKAFVNSFSEALSYELKGTGVTCTVSCPGPVATEFAGIAGNHRSPLFDSGVATAADIANEAYDAMMAGRPMVVHGLKFKAMTQSLRISPRAVVLAVAARLNQPGGR